MELNSAQNILRCGYPHIEGSRASFIRSRSRAGIDSVSVPNRQCEEPLPEVPGRGIAPALHWFEFTNSERNAMKTLLKILLSMAVVISAPAIAQKIALVCDLENEQLWPSGRAPDDPSERKMTVIFDKLGSYCSFGGYPVGSCSVTDTSVFMKFQFEVSKATSTYIIDRISGVFTVTSEFTPRPGRVNTEWRRRYMCAKQDQKF